MILSIENLNQIPFENENAKILIKQVIEEKPNAMIDFFHIIDISEKLALEIWLLANA